MHLNVLRPNINYTFEKYLSTYDLFYKYNLKQVEDVPNIKKLSIELELKDFLFASELSEKNQKHILSQTKFYLFTYLCFNFLPQINFIRSDISKTKTANMNEINYSLCLNFSTYGEINLFLYTLFIENFSKLRADNFNFFRKSELNSKIHDLKSFLFSVYLPGNSLNENLNIFKGLLNIKNLKYKLKILINNPKLKNNQNIIKNLPYFWING